MATAKKPATAGGKSNEKEEIRKLIDGFFAAMCKKDINTMISYYAADAIMFDVKAPFQTKGAIAWKHNWEAGLPFFPDSFEIEVKDLVITAGADVAFAHFLFRLVTANKDHDAAQTWLRATSGYKKQQGRWKIVHEHGSVPFNPLTLQAIFTKDPNAECEVYTPM